MFLIVFSARKSCLPISRLVRPLLTRMRISRSRSVNPGSPGACSSFGASPLIRAISRVVAPGSSMDWPEATVRTAETRSVPVICLRT